MSKLLLLLTILMTSLSFPQDVKEATWSAGIPDTDSYESLAFWIKDNQRAYIRYLHGKDTDDIELSWAGADSAYGRRGFKAAFPAPDHRVLFITLIGDSLLVAAPGHPKKFHWENENGPGDNSAACSICAQNLQQAAGWLRKYFWN